MNCLKYPEKREVPVTQNEFPGLEEFIKAAPGNSRFIFENGKLLALVANKLKNRVLFPESLGRAKEYISKIVMDRTA